MRYFAGIDIGASTTKSVVINESKEILGRHVVKSGADLPAAAQVTYQQALREAGLQPRDIHLIATTGFGRHNFPGAQRTITEISCHTRGAFHYFPRPITIVDIGGQDNKVIHVDGTGRIINFKMNRKCAAGTGTFIEEIAYKMDLPLGELNRLAKESVKDLRLGSYCTVFSATEILTKIRIGEKKEDIVRGVFCSVAQRIIEMDPLEGDVVMTGGVVAHNEIIAELLGLLTNKKILLPPEPQIIGALGAALIVIPYAEEKV